MAEELTGNTNHSTTYPVAIATLVCGTLEAGAVIYGATRPAKPFDTPLEMIATMQVIPFIVGLIFGIYQTPKFVGKISTTLYIAGILLGLAVEWMVLGTVLSYRYPQDEFARHGFGMFLFLVAYMSPLALLGVAVGTSMTKLNISAPPLTGGAATASGEADGPIGGYVSGPEDESLMFRHPYISGTVAVLFGALFSFGVKLGPLTAQVGMLAFGAIVAHRRVNDWRRFAVELSKIHAIIFGLLAPFYLILMLQILFMSLNPSASIFMVLSALMYITPWVAGGMLVGWKLWK